MRARDKLLFGLLCVWGLGICGLIGMSSIGRNMRNGAIAELRRTAAELPQRPSASTSSPSRTNESLGHTRETQDSIAVYSRLFKQVEMLQKDQAWETVLEAVQRDDSEEFIPNITLKNWTSEERDRVGQFLWLYRSLILEIRRVADTSGPVALLDYSKGYQMELNHLNLLRDITRLLNLDGIFWAEKGDYAETAENAVATMKLARNLAYESLFISQSLRFRMCATAASIIERSIPGKNLSPAVIQTLIAQAAAAIDRESYARAAAMEGEFGIILFERCRNDTSAIEGVFRFGMCPGARTDPITAGLTYVFTSPIGSPLLEFDECFWVESMTELSEAARFPYFKATSLLNQERERSRERAFTRYLNPISAKLTRSSFSFLEQQATHEARMGLMQVGLAVELYHAQNGQYPSSLDAVAPILDGNVPLDPFTGQPFVYQPSGDSFTLYSARDSTQGPNDAPHIPDAQGNIYWRGEGK